MRPDVDYRHVHRQPATRLFHGQPAQALKWCKQFLAANPNDAEGWYFQAGALAQLGRLDEAMRAVDQADRLGLPLSRFVAGPRNAFEPLTTSKAFQQRWAQQPQPLLHGPLVGAVTGHSARIWVRTATETNVNVTARPVQGTDPSVTTSARTQCAQDYTAVVELDGLQPDQVYQYEVRLDPCAAGKPVAQGRFRTPPLPGKPVRLRLAFGGGAAYKPAYERMWDVISARRPDLFLFLGDNVYIDAPEDPDYQRYKYYRRQSRPEFRRFTAQTAVYAVYDDHDFGTDDCSGGPHIDVPPWKRKVWEIFRQNWANPYYGGGKTQPGCWFHFSVGDVEFILFDGRFYRTPPKKTPAEQRSMLGPTQKQWLFEGLRRSKARIKFIASPVPWARGTKPGSLDTWDGFEKERDEIFQFIARQRIGGVMLLSADRHRHDIWQIDWPGTYPLYEFESSKLTNEHTHPLMKRALFSWNGRGFGLFDIDTTVPDPTVRYRIVSIDNEVVHEFRVRLSALQP